MCEETQELIKTIIKTMLEQHDKEMKLVIRDAIKYFKKQEELEEYVCHQSDQIKELKEQIDKLKAKKKKK